MKRWGIAVGVLTVVALAASTLFGWSAWRVSQVARAEQAVSDRQVQRIEEMAQDFGRAVEAHQTTTKNKVVTIRETVRREILALDADDLAVAALDEIERFRGEGGDGGDGVDPGAAGVDGK